jgi:CTP synthase
MVGKYTGMTDSYLSVIKALDHAAYYICKRISIVWIDATYLEPEMSTTDLPKYEEAWLKLKSADGILVPGGFGFRGVEGKILAAKYAREHKIPYFGICLGFQIAVIEYARNVLGWEGANSEENVPNTKFPVVVFMPEISKTHMGGTMRLGGRKTLFKNNCLSAKLYSSITDQGDFIIERHRHRYEVNPDYIQDLEGLNFVAQDETGKRQEIFEYQNHPFYLGVQYHPEMKTRPMCPSPPFVGFLLAASKQLQAWIDGKLVLEKLKLDF